MFSVAQLPSNEYALTGNVYLNPADFETLRAKSPHASKTAKDIIVKIKGFFLKAEALGDIPVGHFGANGVHKEMMEIGKLDQVPI